MHPIIHELIQYLDRAHSVFHAVDALAKTLSAAGYTCLTESGDWQLTAGGKYYLTRGGSSLVAFRVPEGSPAGFLMSASHADRPTFQVKQSGELTGKYTRLGVERYGGMLIAPWLDRPLSVAGRAMVQTPTGVTSQLVDIDRDLLLIPNVAIHMNRKANEGYIWNPAVDTLPLMGSEGCKGKFAAALEEAAGGKILGHDLYLYVRQNACVWGIDEEYLSAAALDDLSCVWCCAQGFLNAQDSLSVPVLCVFDSEEVGSCSLQGAASNLLQSVLQRICKELELDMDRMLNQSFMVSADNGHAVHPNHPEYADAENAPVLGGGILLKFNANQRYTTSGVSASLMRKVCQEAGVPTQNYYNRGDLPGGSTLGSISLSHVSVPSVDIGLPQLAMHSCFETVAVQDVLSLVDAMTQYYAMTLQSPADGIYHLL